MEKTPSAVPGIDFSTFVLSLATSAQLHLGLIEHPFDKNFKANVAEAQQTIDILGILEEKTKGNLSEEEKNLLKNLLYDLRLSFIDKKK